MRTVPGSEGGSAEPAPGLERTSLPWVLAACLMALCELVTRLGRVCAALPGA